MEIRLYRLIELMSQGKLFLCLRVESPDTFDYDKTLSVFRSLYGIIIVFVVLAA